MKKLMLVLISLSVVSGCTSTAHDRSLKNISDYDFSVEIPPGWWQPDYTDKYLITKDGLFLQYVLIQQRPLDKPFKFTRKKINLGMLPQEAAGIIIDELASDRNLMNFNLIENAPAVIDGREGFKVLFSYKDKKGATYKTLYYGLISEDSFFNIRYSAPARNYFGKDILTFEEIMSSFQISRR